MHFRAKIVPVVVLVEPIYESNVGSVSRAMANMGVSDLVLISPRCEFTFASQQAAATGQFALQNKRIYSSWNEFFQNEPNGFLWAFTARDGKNRQNQFFAESLKNVLQSDFEIHKTEKEVFFYLVFGREDAGLSQVDLDHCHRPVKLPTFGQNTSLNLSQAALLALFILRSEWPGEFAQNPNQASGAPKTDSLPMNKHPSFDFPDAAFKKFLLALGLSIDSPKTNIYLVLHRLFRRALPNEKENDMLKIIFEQGARKLDAKGNNNSQAD